VEQHVHIHERGPRSGLASGRITIDLRALQANYRALARVAQPARTAGVVKADAYGLGIAEVGPALAAAGCDTFFVALPEEGLALRTVAPRARIFVLGGLFGAQSADAMLDAGLIPVLNGASDLAIWESRSALRERSRACAIAVDTGMNRLGMTPAQALAFAEDNALTRAVEPVLVMSHLACADMRDHPANRNQLDALGAVLEAFPGVEASLSNSAGLLLGRDFHLDLTRPGIAVYGGSPSGGVTMRTVVTAEARVLQVRQARAGETVSYGATEVLQRDTLIAVTGAGYADGLPRAASGAGVPLREIFPGGCGVLHGRRVPILGRVTMDLTMFDVTDLGPDGVAVGDMIQLFGPDLPIDEAAAAAGMVAYELLTGLGRRFERVYVGHD
jgi:alanine racemase